MAQDSQLPDIKLDSAHLYREETFTDRRGPGAIPGGGRIKF